MKTHVEKRRGERNCLTCAFSSVDTSINERENIRKRDGWKRGASRKSRKLNFPQKCNYYHFTLSELLLRYHLTLFMLLLGRKFSLTVWIFHGIFSLIYSLTICEENNFNAQNFLLLLARRMHILAKAVSIRHKKKNLLNYLKFNRKLFELWNYSVELC